jgi:hypothetical protein
MADSSGRPETVTFSIDDLGTPIELGVNQSYRLVFEEEPDPIAHLNLVLTNYVDKMPVEGIGYEIEGCGEKLSGQTRKGGVISHKRVPAGCYRLKVQDRQYTVPTDPDPGRFHLLYVVADVRVARHLPEYDEADLQGLSDEEIAAIVEGADDIEAADAGDDTEPSGEP